ncbi:MAG: hypothetical protein HON70_00930, partial [Lentisphaerae bacterium]|nr:hypothetical protein [Lentisphaerota bacterium]
MPRLSDRMLDSISLQALKSTCTFGLVVLTLAGVYSISPRVVRPRHAYTGDQADEWHITESDTVLAHSRIVLSDCEANPHVLRLDLPYAGATAESVTLEGEPIDFDQVLTGSTQPTGVYLALNRPASALRGELLEVVWSLPLQALQVSPDNYRTELK